MRTPREKLNRATLPCAAHHTMRSIASAVHEGFDTQSYDTDPEAFADVISHVAQAPAGKQRVLIVTDCLSGSQALWRFHTRISVAPRKGWLLPR